MANAGLQAIGAQVANPGRQVISMSGDGGFSMLMGDVLTLKTLNLPVKVVIFNNGLLGFSVDIEMKAAGLLPTGTRLDNPNFAEMAKTIGNLWCARRRSRGAGGLHAIGIRSAPMVRRRS